MPDADFAKLGSAYERALDSWGKEVGKLTVDFEGLKKQLDGLDKSDPKAKKLKVDLDEVNKKLEVCCRTLGREIGSLPKVPDPKDPAGKKEQQELQKKLPGWMRKTIERVQRGGVKIPYPDVSLEGGSLKVRGVKIWGN